MSTVCKSQGNAGPGLECSLRAKVAKRWRCGSLSTNDGPSLSRAIGAETTAVVVTGSVVRVAVLGGVLVGLLAVVLALVPWPSFCGTHRPLAQA